MAKKKKNKVIHTVNDKGQRCVIVPVDPEKLRQEHERFLNHATARLGLAALFNLEAKLAHILKNEPHVSEYQETSSRLISVLQTYYDQIGPPQKGEPGNVFWYPIRNLDPGDRGRALSFMPEVRSLYVTIVEMIEIKKQTVGE